MEKRSQPPGQVYDSLKVVLVTNDDVGCGTGVGGKNK